MEERTERLIEYRGFVSEVLDLMKKENIGKSSSSGIFNGRKLIIEKAIKELHLSNRRAASCVNIIHDIYKSGDIEYYLSNDLFIINIFENKSFENRTRSCIGNYLSKLIQSNLFKCIPTYLYSVDESESKLFYTWATFLFTLEENNVRIDIIEDVCKKKDIQDKIYNIGQWSDDSLSTFVESRIRNDSVICLSYGIVFNLDSLCHLSQVMLLEDGDNDSKWKNCSKYIIDIIKHAYNTCNPKIISNDTVNNILKNDVLFAESLSIAFNKYPEIYQVLKDLDLFGDKYMSMEIKRKKCLTNILKASKYKYNLDDIKQLLSIVLDDDSIEWISLKTLGLVSDYTSDNYHKLVHDNGVINTINTVDMSDFISNYYNDIVDSLITKKLLLCDCDDIKELLKTILEDDSSDIKSTDIKRVINKIAEEFPYMTQYNSVLDSIMKELKPYVNKQKANNLNDRIKAKRVKKENKDNKKIEEAIATVENYVGSDSIYLSDFCERYGIPKNTMTRYLRIVEENNPELYSKYEDKAGRYSKSNIKTAKIKLKDVIDHIHSNSDYSLYDYYVVDKMDIDVYYASTLLSSIDIPIYKKSSFKSWAAKMYPKMVPVSERYIYDDKYEIMVNGVPTLVTDEMKTDVLKFMSINHIPLYWGLFASIERAYLREGLDISV